VATLLEGRHFDRSGRSIILNIVLSGNVEPLILLKGLLLRLGIGIAIGLGAGGLLTFLNNLNFCPKKIGEQNNRV